MLTRTALLVLGLVAACMAQSTFTVMSAPKYVQFDKSAGALPLESVGQTLSASLGLTSELNWSGLVAGTPFEQPQASVVVVLDAAAGVPSGVAQFDLAHKDGSFSTLASRLVATHAGAFAPVLSKAFQAATNILSASASKDISSVTAGHSLHWDAAAMTFKDSAKTLSLSEAQIADLFSKITLDGVSFDEAAKAFTVTLADKSTVTLSLATFSSFFHEVFAVLEVASRFAASAQASSAPASIALALSTLPTALASAASEAETQAVQKVTASFLAALTLSMNKAFAGQVVVSAASVSGSSDAAQVRVARGLISSLGAPNPQTAGKYKPNQPAFVEYCSQYKCFCNQDSQGNPWDVDTGCQKGCKPGSLPFCECAAYGCACNSTSVVDVSSECIKCAAGYVLRGNACFVDNGWVVQFNMVLVLGIFAVLSLLATCYAIGNMDPGRNSIIYRMTSGRLKTQ